MFFFPISVDVPMTRLPLVNWLLMVVICGTSFFAALDAPFRNAMMGVRTPQEKRWSLEEFEQLSDEQQQQMAEELVEEGFINFRQRPVFDPPAWKLPVLACASPFLHAGVLHLVGNMIFLWTFGNAVNYKFGQLPYLLFFFLGAVVSGTAFFLTTPERPLIGASGAIMAVVGAFAVFFPRNDVTVVSWFVVWTKTFRVPSWTMIGLWFGLDLLFLLAGRQTGIAYIAHVAGFLTGMMIGLALAGLGILRPTRYEETLVQMLGLR